MRNFLSLLLITASALAGEIKETDIDLTPLKNMLPEKWYISSVQRVSVPDGWKKMGKRFNFDSLVDF